VSILLGVGIMFLIIGSTPYFIKKVNGTINNQALSMYKNIKITGLSVLVLLFIGNTAGHPFQYILPVIPVMLLCIWTVFHIQKVLLKTKENG
jgi:ABC-type uncharacterized transport system permease subunit